ALDRGVGIIRKNYESTLKKGKLTQAKFDERVGLIKGTLSYDDLKDADLIIEAVFEDLGVKEQVFRKLDEVAKPGAILASNTSTLDVDKIASFTKRPQDDKALEKFGMVMGPFRMGDLAGNDIGWAIRKRHYAEDPGFKAPTIDDKLCELGRFGQKTGKGWYRYEPGRRDPVPDPEVEK